MKKIVSLLVASFMVVSVMGQKVKSYIPQSESNTGMEVLKDMTWKGFEIDDFQSEGKAQLPTVHQVAQSVNQHVDSVIVQLLGLNGEIYIYERRLYNYYSIGKIEKYVRYFYSEYGDMGGQKEDFIFDSKGQNTQCIQYKWDRNKSNWVGDWKFDYTYNSNGQVDQNISYIWHPLDSQWGGVRKVESTYNSNGQQTDSIVYLWDANVTQWVNSQKIENSYTSNGQLTQRINYQWGQYISKWVGAGKDEYIYDVNGNETQSISYSWDNQWILNSKEESSYNSTGDVTTLVVYEWNTSLQQWDKLNLVETTYDTNGNLTQTVESKKLLSADLVGVWKNVYSYDSNGNQILAITYNFDAGQWNLISKHEFTYDLNGNETKNIGYLKSKFSSEWILRETNESIYNSNGNLKQKIILNDQSNIVNRSTWYYSDVDTSITAPASAGELKTFPNPASEYITFNIEDASQPASVELFDMHGKKVVTQMLPESKQIEVSQLKSGMYFYKIRQGNKIYKGKVVVK